MAEGLVSYSKLLLAAPFRAVGPRDEERILREILLDSLAPALMDLIPSGRDGTLLDMGCGPGSVSIPLALFCPGLRITGVDSKEKRIRFATLWAGELGLSNLRFVCGYLAAVSEGRETIRALRRELGIPDSGVEWITSRGVGSLSEVLLMAEPFLSRSGKLLVYSTAAASSRSMSVLDDSLKSKWSFGSYAYERSYSAAMEYQILECTRNQF